MSLNILLAEDDPLLQRQIVDQMAQFGHRTTAVGDGAAALAVVSGQMFDVVVLDWLLPAMDGIAVLRRLREEDMTVPVLMLTALSQTLDKVEALEAGADDYVVKPVDPLELNARLHALVRARKTSQRQTDTLAAGDIVVSPSRLTAWRAGHSLVLSQIEFKLLHELVRDAGTVLTRPMLIERVWGHDYVTTSNIVDAHIRQLRLKLLLHGDDPIGTVRGVGYVLRT
jgi:DNA-binding response OmpR family regulator